MDNARILAVLNEGTLSLEGQFLYSSNYTFMVACKFKNHTIKAVYKPLRGERPLWDFPKKTLARREVAAFLVSEALGWNIVPTTVFRHKNAPMGPGSLQIFVEHDPDYHYFTLKNEDQELLPCVILFDLLINNADRKAGHLLFDPEGRLWLIDHGVCFHVEDKLRTVIWNHTGEVIPTSLLTAVKNILPQLVPGETLHQVLLPHLLEREIEALIKRAKMLVSSGVFPLPPEDRRAYPWPLV